MLMLRFRRPRLLIVGCGDVGARVSKLLHHKHWNIIALTSSNPQSNPTKWMALRQLGIVPFFCDLDKNINASTWRRLSGWAMHARILHLAPPSTYLPATQGDPRTARLIRGLKRKLHNKATRRTSLLSLSSVSQKPSKFIYASTSGVYGDLQGNLATENLLSCPVTPRAMRRSAAEKMLRKYCSASVLRVPGIYAKDRVDGTPEKRLRKRTPTLVEHEDVYTNHIHADDLARACILALFRGQPKRIYNINDDTRMKMGDYFDAAADFYGLSRPERISKAMAQDTLPSMQLSFMSESRQMDNTRMKRELRLTLNYPTPIW